MNPSIELAKASFLAILSTVFLGAGVFEVRGSGGGGEGASNAGRGGELDVLAVDWDRDGLEDDWEEVWSSVGWGLGYSYEQFETQGYRYEDMEGWWQMDEASMGGVGSCADRSVGNHWLLGGAGVDWKNGIQKFGLGYVRLSGSGYLSSSVSGVYHHTGEKSFSAWVRRDGSDGEGHVIGLWREIDGKRGWEVGVRAGGHAYGKVVVEERRELASVVIENGRGINVQDGQWHHVVLVYGLEKASLYVDGRLEDEKSVRGEMGYECGRFEVGGAGWEGSYWQGDVDEVRLYGRVLNGGEVNLLPNGEADPDGDGMNNWLEQEFKSNPLNGDSDGDGLSDGYEYSDVDGDGMPSGWELDHGLDPQNGSDGEGDADGDGVSNAQEYENGSNPWDYFNGDLSGVEVSVKSGAGQKGAAGKVLGQAVVIEVKKNGVGLGNAPVKIQVIGMGEEAGSVSGAGAGWGEQIEIRTSLNGEAGVWWKLGEKEFIENYGEAKVESGSGSASVSFSALSLGDVPIGGLKLWVNGAKLGVEGSVVGTVEDWSGSNNALVQLSTSKKPKVGGGWNGKKVLEFDGVDDVMSYTAIGGNAVSVVMVYEVGGYSGLYSGPISNKPSVGEGFRVMGTLKTGNKQVGEAEGEYLVNEEAQGVYVPGWSTTENVWSVKAALEGKAFSSGPEMQMWKNAVGNIEFYRDGEAVGLNTESWVGGSNATLDPYFENGGWIGKAEGYLKGKIGEVMVWDRLLSESEREQVELYIQKRYGLTDEDGDGIKKWKELELGLNPSEWDSNGDGVKDGVVFKFVSGVGADGQLIWTTLDGTSNDVDGDGLSNAEEYLLGTNVYWNDSDGDGILDGQDGQPLSADNGGIEDPNTVLELLSISEPSGAQILP